MNNSIFKTLVIYAVVLPLAVLIGWMAVDLPNWDKTAFAFFVAIVFVLLLPVLLKWHYPVLIFSWNTAITIFFLPGEPGLWMIMAGLNVGIAVLNRIMTKRAAFIAAPSIAIPLIALALVVIITAKLRGGIGLRSLGATTQGGKGYIFIFAAIIGYFAVATRSIPPEKAKKYMGLFFLPGLVTAGSTLIYYAGPAFYPLFLVFPVGYASVQASTELSNVGTRLAGFAAGAPAVIYYLLATCGIRGVLGKWWRPLVVLGALGLCTFGGYRSAILGILLTCVLLFMVEGLMRTAIFPFLLIAGVIGFAALIPLTPTLPYATQRSLSFLPIPVESAVRRDADDSLAWRVEIWKAVVPDLPKYFWLGKGYAVNMTDLYLSQQAYMRNRAPFYESALATGDYHSGPLSVYMPFGVFGSLAFIAFLFSSIRGLYLNYRYGREELKTINRFVFAYFVSRTIFFFGAFGGITADLPYFAGLAGISIALNNGICRRPVRAPAPAPVRIRRDMPLRGAGTQPGLA